jgi:hypothetical protein
MVFIQDDHEQIGSEKNDKQCHGAYQGESPAKSE